VRSMQANPHLARMRKLAKELVGVGQMEEIE
jgi:hypothetical protein